MKLSISYRMALCFGVVLASAIPSLSQDKNLSRTIPSEYKASIEGLVRDVACPMQNHKSTATNFNLECALACAKSGSPLIILTRSGDIYFPMSDQMPDPSQREKMMPYVGKFVRATGTIYQRNGTRTIVIEDIKELKNVKLNPKVGDD